MKILTRIAVPGYEGVYAADISGRIWSEARKVVSGRWSRLMEYGNKYLVTYVSRSGYFIVTLCKDGKPRSYSLHTIIALTFIGPRPSGYVINHIDGNKLNNVPSNLEYCTPQENIDHAIRMGLINNVGVHNPNYRHGRYINETTIPRFRM